MANNLNGFYLSGNLVRDGELKYTQSGKSVVRFSIANGKKSGDKEKVSYFDCELWGKIAESLSQYLLKGTKVNVSGEIVQDRWVDQQSGQKRSKVKFTVQKIELVSGNRNNQNQNNGYGSQNNNYNNQSYNNQRPPQNNNQNYNNNYQQQGSNGNYQGQNNNQQNRNIQGPGNFYNQNNNPYANNNNVDDDIPF